MDGKYAYEKMLNILLLRNFKLNNTDIVLYTY